MGCALHHIAIVVEHSDQAPLWFQEGRQQPKVDRCNLMNDECSNEHEWKDGGQIMDGTPKSQSYGRHETKFPSNASSMKQKGCAGGPACCMVQSRTVQHVQLPAGRELAYVLSAWVPFAGREW